MDYDFVDYFNKHYHTVQKTKKSLKNPYVKKAFFKQLLGFTIAIAFKHRNWIEFGMFPKQR